ncbi:hypothetical protein H2203_001099 [Taxawa tesnikishii (nom. ined.)]|nr:hypothetical protein H2203_001099 [Dothideales sp. JES 119]
MAVRDDLRRGQFIDTYIGEIIVATEADLRERNAPFDKASYMFSLDKFAEEQGIDGSDCYVVDGEFMGGPTRFINHSCDPNCGIYTVSYDKYDEKIYELAFFAMEDVPKGTELTFDYMDADDEEEEGQRDDTHTAEDAHSGRKVPCNCGTSRCRKYLWV